MAFLKRLQKNINDLGHNLNDQANAAVTKTTEDGAEHRAAESDSKPHRAAPPPPGGAATTTEHRAAPPPPASGTTTAYRAAPPPPAKTSEEKSRDAGGLTKQLNDFTAGISHACTKNTKEKSDDGAKIHIVKKQ
eukprot:CAMPEP_0177638326 /NCGR_PEP_ID=MMETSP0447-20121125/5427_1 /TAXON_ID=0 /ORGANISM="Stygamoeba regulata, Strain BSH-02190019" /LENGTH=133 /DNA_ID=CAMNT_0019140277 /DNA_START=50 /DNA_END=451 /DNA_ORIENTATION=-